MADATFSGNRAALYRRLLALPAALAGQGPDPGGQARFLLRAVGIEVLTILKDAYVDKARGGTDAAGITWAPLSPRYLAYGRRHKGLNARRTRARKAGRGRRPLLTATQDKRWRQVYAQALARLRRDGVADGSGRAAAIAWATVKREGGRTIIGQYGNATVEIGRDTGRLLGSLSPGARDNILRTGPGTVAVGTNVEYAQHFHKRRPMWPEPDAWPQEWKDRLGEVVQDGMVELIRRALEAAS